MYLLIIGIFIVILVVLAKRPFRLNREVKPDPVDSYQEAISRIQQIQAEESSIKDLNPVCETRLFTHGNKVENVIVFLHGFTSCPDQFSRLGQEYYDEGFNVYIPRVPRHGRRDILGTTLKGFTAEEMAMFASEAVDIAQGLGTRVVVVGLSGGGSMAIWLSSERADVDLAVPIAPFLGVGFIPRVLNRPLTNLVLLIPDFFQWWDPIHKEKNPNSAPYSYRRYPIHALFENLRLGYAAAETIKNNEPAARALLTITNANDISVNNSVVDEFEVIWSSHGQDLVQSYRFPKELQLPHDLITVNRPDSKVELVYPKLHELIK